MTPRRVDEPGMLGAREHPAGALQLADPPHPLQPLGVEQVLLGDGLEGQRGAGRLVGRQPLRQLDVPVDGVADEVDRLELGVRHGRSVARWHRLLRRPCRSVGAGGPNDPGAPVASRGGGAGRRPRFRSPGTGRSGRPPATAPPPDRARSRTMCGGLDGGMASCGPHGAPDRRPFLVASRGDPATAQGCPYMKVGVARETAPGERRVALVPETLARLRRRAPRSSSNATRGSDRPSPTGVCGSRRDHRLHRRAVRAVGRDLACRSLPPRRSRSFAGPGRRSACCSRSRPAVAADLAARGVTTISLDAIPRTLSRAQSMDALSSQANVGGYKAVLMAANAYGRYFPC